MNLATRHPLPLVLTLLALATTGVGAEDRAPAAAPAEASPVVSLPTATPPVKPTAEKSAPAKGKGAATTDAKPITPPPLSPRFQQVRDRIKVLYAGRDERPPPPDPRYDPFRTQAVGPAEPATASPGNETGPTPVPTASDATLLKQAAALLKMNGWVERDGRTFLSINGSYYRDGDVIKIVVQNQHVFLRITKLSRTSLTVKLNDAETTLNF